ncbi:response regulator [Gracilibacillus alcaliphilus]|uniref:response regulator n=1 Tax=Gracilibacillus alcaliphilus TaxID=1401441 RepID=UPI001EF95C5C|nr:response regulator [Gracilibacillus alcaliphilus]MBM7675665.1 two-component system response regulator YesN [Gracilibacillus alcaliphilus]
MQKWKVLIADDEFMIRDGIRSVINWADYHMEVVAEAEDGEEALELASAYQIDIALIDLNMPIMDGMTAMKKIKEQLPDCRMVVISGYDEFRFAQEAIRLQVEDYLLKPVDPQQLENILAAVQKQLEQQQATDQYVQQAASQVEKNRMQLRNRFFQDWLSSNLSETEVLYQLQFFDLPAAFPHALLVFKWLEGEKAQQLLLHDPHRVTDEVLCEWLETKLQPYHAAIYKEQGQWVTVFLWEGLPQSFTAQLEEAATEELGQHLVAQLTVIEEISAATAYHQAKQALHQRVQLPVLVKEALQYIREHYQDPDLTLERVADYLHISVVYLSKTLKQELGISYVQIVTKLRLEAAKELLKTTDYNIREVAEQVGYDSQHYFSTAFRKVTGVTPKQFKQQV